MKDHSPIAPRPSGARPLAGITMLLLAALLLWPPAPFAPGVSAAGTDHRAAGSSSAASTPSREQAERQFGPFVKRWLDDMSSRYLGKPGSPHVRPAEGGFLAEYYQLDRDSIQHYVQRSESNPEVYVGVVKYVEYLYRSTGRTESQAIAGPFEPYKKLKITELFLYHQGKWGQSR